MEKFPISSAAGARLASLIDHRLRGNQRLFVVSVDAGDTADNAARGQARRELLSLLDEIRNNVAASGVCESDLGQAIDETIADVRAARK
jgi:hypothetical protein